MSCCEPIPVHLAEVKKRLANSAWRDHVRVQHTHTTGAHTHTCGRAPSQCIPTSSQLVVSDVKSLLLLLLLLLPTSSQLSDVCGDAQTDAHTAGSYNRRTSHRHTTSHSPRVILCFTMIVIVVIRVVIIVVPRRARRLEACMGPSITNQGVMR